MADKHDDRRSSKRIDARIDVMFRTNKEFVACYTQNLSKGGIYLETAELPDPNANIELVLDLSSATDDPALGRVSLTGKVVRLMSVTMDGKKIHKVAIQFVDTPPQIQAKIDSLYNKLLEQD
jgi:Tfp pilus assembly protein PilZ